MEFIVTVDTTELDAAIAGMDRLHIFLETAVPDLATVRREAEQARTHLRRFSLTPVATVFAAPGGGGATTGRERTGGGIVYEVTEAQVAALFNNSVLPFLRADLPAGQAAAWEDLQPQVRATLLEVAEKALAYAGWEPVLVYAFRSTIARLAAEEQQGGA